MPLDVSVIIINWNTRDTLRDCLNSVYEQTQGINFEVIVVDNASSDSSAEMVRTEFTKAILVENKENRGFAVANNQGMSIAKGRYMLLLNSDTIVLDGAIQKTIRFVDQHTEAAVVGCKVLNPDRTMQATCFMFPSLLNLFLSATYLYKVFPRSRFFGRERMTWWDRQDVREVEVVTGCFMLVRKEAIDEVGMMDESFFMYAEETDWCYRFKKAGWRSLFFPNATTIHLGGQSSKQVKMAMIIQVRRAILQFIKKNHGLFYYWMGRVLVLLFFFVRIPFWIAVAVLASRRQIALDTAKAYWRGSWIIFTGK